MYKFPMQICQIIQRISPLSVEAEKKLLQCITECSFPKGHTLMKTDKTEQFLYFIKKGIVRAYAMQDDIEVTFWFGKEGDTILSMKSYVEQQPGYENIELLENCELYKMNISDLQKLYQEDIHIANWGRKIAEKELIKTEERLISRQFKTATERYQQLLKEQSDILQRVSLGLIASYLGITQVSLSRIRAEIR